MQIFSRICNIALLLLFDLNSLIYNNIDEKKTGSNKQQQLNCNSYRDTSYIARFNMIYVSTYSVDSYIALTYNNLNKELYIPDNI